MGAIAAAFLLLLAVWSVLLATPLIGRICGEALAVPTAFLLATALTWTAREGRRSPPNPSLRLVCPAFLTGLLGFPAWAALILGIGSAIGLEAGTLPRPLPPDPLLWLTFVGIAPVLEELLYRERLLLALRPRLGGTPAVVASSLLFALPHLEPWQVLGAFVMGLGLGLVMHLGGRVLPCIALHAGLNLASLSVALAAPELVMLAAW